MTVTRVSASGESLTRTTEGAGSSRLILMPRWRLAGWTGCFCNCASCVFLASTTRPPDAFAFMRCQSAALENARLNLEYCTIRSPLDGFVGKVLLQAGNLAKANDVNPLVVINQVRPIYVNFAVPEQSLPEVRKRMAEAPLEVEVLPVDPSQARPKGRLIFVDNAVDPSTGTIRLRAQFDNQDAALWPGQFVNVSVRLYDEPDAILVPSTAVQTGPEGQYAYVLADEMTAELRRLTVKPTQGARSI